MHYGVTSPAEDEMAIMGLSDVSPCASWLFPENYPRYDKYFDFSTASEEEKDRWKQTLLYFLKKIHCKYDRPLILKSPSHTPRVRMWLDLFPQAKFVHIHRHPYDVYVSLLNLARKVLPVVTVQPWDFETQRRRIVQVYRFYLDAYFEQRHMIPEGNLVEIGFRELEQSPISTLRTVYEQLSLPTFDETEPAVAKYLETIAAYRKNTYAEIDAEMKSLLSREWSRSFEEWGYSD